MLGICLVSTVLTVLAWEQSWDPQYKPGIAACSYTVSCTGKAADPWSSLSQAVCLANQWSPSSLREPVSKIMWKALEEDIWHQPLSSTHIHDKYIQKHACMNAHTYPHRCMYATNATLLIKVVLPIHTKQKYFISDIPHLYLHQEVIVTYPECLCYGKFCKWLAIMVISFSLPCLLVRLGIFSSCSEFLPFKCPLWFPSSTFSVDFFLFLSLKKKSCKLSHLDQV